MPVFVWPAAMTEEHVGVTDLFVQLRPSAECSMKAAIEPPASAASTTTWTATVSNCPSAASKRALVRAVAVAPMMKRDHVLQASSRMEPHPSTFGGTSATGSFP